MFALRREMGNGFFDQQQEGNLSQWVRSPLSILITSTDKEASLFASLIQQMDCSSQDSTHRLRIALILSEYDDPSLKDNIYKAPESDVLIGSANALVALLERGGEFLSLTCTRDMFVSTQPLPVIRNLTTPCRCQLR